MLSVHSVGKNLGTFRVPLENSICQRHNQNMKLTAFSFGKIYSVKYIPSYVNTFAKCYLITIKRIIKTRVDEKELLTILFAKLEEHLTRNLNYLLGN